MFENIKILVNGQKTNLVQVDGNKTITRIEYVSGADRQVNQVYNAYDLLSFEIRSDTLELFFEDKFLGRGYVGDLAGMTVDINRIPTKKPEQEPAGEDLVSIQEPNNDEIPFIKAEGIRKGNIRPTWEGGEYQTVPCVILEGSPKVSKIRFAYLREIPGMIIDDVREKRYALDPDSRIEIKMPDGVTAPGYICDPVGKTIRISRDVKVKAQIPIVKDGRETGEYEEVLVDVKFAGALGKLSSGDRLPKLLSGMAGRENLFQMAIAFGAGLLIMGVL